MTPPQHFLVSFAASLLGATILAVGVLLGRDWFDAHGFPSSLLALALFILGHLAIRSCFRHCVPVTCSRCQNKSCFAIPGRSDRFRCEVCGADS